MSELVALLEPDDDGGRQVGVAPRERVRAENLPHSATGVLVTRPDGAVLVHRRSPDKDLWPGLLDVACGGVLVAGEEPEAGARRELAEEVGIDDPALVLEPLGAVWYRDESTWYLGHRYRVVWDGPVEFVDGEVTEAWWEPQRVIAALLADPASPLVPDTRALFSPFFR
jgi:8-oxo-dGTP pyrophosphatase MutT (NUDIX family)